MNRNIEKEYKILVSKEDFESLLSLYPEASCQRQVNTYYDTVDYAIKKAHGAMRIRELNGYTFTLKLPSEQGLLEFEKEVSGNDISIFDDEEITNLLSSYTIYRPFTKLTTLTTDRILVKTDVAELCFDKSYYNGCVDYEIEYEYKADHDGLATFQTILQQVNLYYEKNCISKIQRAMNSL